MSSGILFDLDGTLLDTAPDLAFALNKLLCMKGEAPLPFSIIRPQAGHGGKGLIKLGFRIEEDHPHFIDYWQTLLSLYSEYLDRSTHLFPGMDKVLAYLEASHLPWGIVTNKPGWLTEPLLEKLHLRERAACVVSGDTLPTRKPDPAPLRYASQLLSLPPEKCVYIGDGERDIQAGNAAGMQTILALYGYISEFDQPTTWKSHASIQQPEEIIGWLEKTIL